MYGCRGEGVRAHLLGHLGNHEQLLNRHGAGELLGDKGKVAGPKHLQLSQHLRYLGARLHTKKMPS
jgi:hypothetical protein